MRVCEVCHLEFENHGVYANHIRWNHKEVPYTSLNCKYCNATRPKSSIIKHEKSCSKNPKNIKHCLHCNAIVTGYRKRFCNNSCSAKYSNTHRTNIDRSYITPEWRAKMRKSTIKQWLNGVHNPSRPIYSSKNERAIVKHFKETYPNDNWKTSGRLVLEDGSFLSRDLWSDKLKICFEYDGIWHFKDIKGQLKQKQTKDRLLEEWCKKNNYRLIRVDENNYQDVKQIENLIYNS
jgi:hypothetical protein